MLQQSSKPSHSENETNKGPLSTSRVQIYFPLCLYGSSSTIGTSIWVRSLRHEGSIKSLLSLCTHRAMPPNGTVGGSWSEERAEPTPLRVLLVVLELTEGQVWLCLLPMPMEPETLAAVAAGCLGLMNLGCSKSRIPDCFRKCLF